MKAINNLAKLFFCLCAFLGTSIYCEAEELATTSLDMEQRFVYLDGASCSSEDEVTYRLSAATPDSPMPADSQDGQCTFRLKGNTTGSTPVISFPRAGIFEYQLQADIPDSFPYQWTPQVYHIQVYVNNDGNCLNVVTNQEQSKVATLSAVYTSPTRQPVDKEPIDSGNGTGTGNIGEGPKSPALPDVTTGRTLPKTSDSTRTYWLALCIVILLILIIFYEKERINNLQSAHQNGKEERDE